VAAAGIGAFCGDGRGDIQADGGEHHEQAGETELGHKRSFVK
jgi:hypothetical protein